MRRNNQSGFSLGESILVIALAVVIVFAVYYFGWGAKGQAEVKALESDVKTVEMAVGAYFIQSNGLYPTDDGKRPAPGEHKWIIWDASFTDGGQGLCFYPDFIKRLPRHWNEGVWRIDNAGRATVAISP